MEPLATLLVETLLDPVVLIAAVVVSLALISGLLAGAIELWEVCQARVMSGRVARTSKPVILPVRSPSTTAPGQRLAAA